MQSDSALANIGTAPYAVLSDTEVSLFTRNAAIGAERSSLRAALAKAKAALHERSRAVVFETGGFAVAPDLETQRLTKEVEARQADLAALDPLEANVRALLTEVRAELNRRKLERDQRAQEALMAEYRAKYSKAREKAISAIVEFVHALAWGKEQINPESLDPLAAVQHDLVVNMANAPCTLQGEYKRVTDLKRQDAHAKVVADNPRLG